MPRSLISNLEIGEIAFCRSGIHPGAKIVLYKRRRDEDLERLRKGEDGPRSFSEHYEGSRLMEIDGAIDRRLYALLDTTTDIMRSDVSNREELVLSAVEAYATTMKADVPELFAGRLAKALEEQREQVRPDGRVGEYAIHLLMKSELEGAGLLPAARQGGTMMEKFLKALSERGKDALSYVLGGRDPAEVFKGLGEDAQVALSGLFNKAGEWADRIDSLSTDLEKAKTDLEKARADPVDPNSLESILKAVTDPGARAYIETQAAAVKTLSGEFTKLQKATRRAELVAVVKGFECLPNANDALVVTLEKADAAGIVDDVQAVLKSANEQARFGKAMQELGLESIPGEGSTATPEEANEALVAKATEIRKGRSDLTPEQALDLAYDQNPELFAATRRPRVAAH